MKTVRLLAMLRQVAGAEELTVPFAGGGTVRELVSSVGDACPELKAKVLDGDGELTGFVHIMVNGRLIRWLDGLDTAVALDDEVVMMPMIGGG